MGETRQLTEGKWDERGVTENSLREDKERKKGSVWKKTGDGKAEEEENWSSWGGITENGSGALLRYGDVWRVTVVKVED